MSAIALAAAIGVVACDESGDGRAGATAGGQGDPCDVDVETLLSCADESCDLDALDQALAACTVDDKADGIGDTLREWMKRIQEKLADKAKSCYESKSTTCLEGVYYALAAGAKVKGMHNAAGMMWHFLRCNEGTADVDGDVIRIDESVVTVMESARSLVWQHGEELVSQGQPDGEYPVTVAKTPVSADSADIWYAMGSFHVEGEAKVTLEGGAVASIEIDYKATDRYDWHPGAAAGGTADGVSAFEDAWAQYLVDEGAACEFDMVGEWSETITEAPPTVEQPPPQEPAPLGEGDCCEDHGGRGCEVEACQMAVCGQDPFCCDTEWEILCVDEATKLSACDCEAPDEGGMDDAGEEGGMDDAGEEGGMGDAGEEGGGEEGGGEEGGETADSCENACDQLLDTCACDEQCVELEDCCDDYATFCGG